MSCERSLLTFPPAVTVMALSTKASSPSAKAVAAVKAITHIITNRVSIFLVVVFILVVSWCSFNYYFFIIFFSLFNQDHEKDHNQRQQENDDNDNPGDEEVLGGVRWNLDGLDHGIGIEGTGTAAGKISIDVLFCSCYRLRFGFSLGSAIGLSGSWFRRWRFWLSSAFFYHQFNGLTVSKLVEVIVGGGNNGIGPGLDIVAQVKSG